jgi:hypothetical protein
VEDRDWHGGYAERQQHKQGNYFPCVKQRGNVFQQKLPTGQSYATL